MSRTPDGFEAFTIKLPAVTARRLRFVAFEDGESPEAFAAEAIISLSAAAMNTYTPGTTQEDAEKAQAKALNPPTKGVKK